MERPAVCAVGRDRRFVGIVTGISDVAAAGPVRLRLRGVQPRHPFCQAHEPAGIAAHLGVVYGYNAR